MRRETIAQMFSETSLHLADKGWAMDRVQRLQGIDLQNVPAAYEGIKSIQVCMAAFVDMWLPKALNNFKENPQLQLCFYIEDDCRLKREFAYDDLHNAAMQAPDKMFWAGYNIKGKDGRPKWGTQLVACTRESCRKLVSWFAARDFQQTEYYALDTCCRCKPTTTKQTNPAEFLKGINVKPGAETETTKQTQEHETPAKAMKQKQYNRKTNKTTAKIRKPIFGSLPRIFAMMIFLK